MDEEISLLGYVFDSADEERGLGEKEKYMRFALVLMFVLGGCIQVYGNTQKYKRVFFGANEVPPVVRVCSTLGCGTGWYAAETLVVTAAHVIPINAMADAITLYNYHNSIGSREVKLIHWDPMNDIAILEDKYETPKRVLEICDVVARPRSRVKVFGDVADIIFCQSGIVDRVDSETIRYNVVTRPGFSGGPIMYNGCVTGIHLSSHSDIDTGNGVDSDSIKFAIRAARSSFE